MEHQCNKMYVTCFAVALMLLLFISLGTTVESSFPIEKYTLTGLIFESISSDYHKNSTVFGMIQNVLALSTKSQLSISPQSSVTSPIEKIGLAQRSSKVNQLPNIIVINKTIQSPDNGTHSNSNATIMRYNQTNPIHTFNNQQKNNLKAQSKSYCLSLGCEGSPPDLITGKCLADLVVKNGICSSPSRIQKTINN
jgi:hypothetical protein